MPSSLPNHSGSNQVVITGAAGLVARNILPYLHLKNEAELRLLDLKPGVIGNQPVHPIDLRDGVATRDAFRGAKAVVHFAIANYGEGALEDDGSFPNEYHLRMLDVNIKGTYNVFEAARHLGIKRVIYISSMTVAMGHGHESDLNEGLSPKPLNLYACTKLFGEQLAEFYSRRHGMECFCLRLGHPFPTPLKEEVWEDPWLVATLVHFRDIARAVEGALDAQGIGAGVYNITSKNADGFIRSISAKEIDYNPLEDCRKP